MFLGGSCSVYEASLDKPYIKLPPTLRTFIFLGGSCSVIARSNSDRVRAASPALISCGAKAPGFWFKGLTLPRRLLSYTAILWRAPRSAKHGHPASAAPRAVLGTAVG